MLGIGQFRRETPFEMCPKKILIPPHKRLGLTNSPGGGQETNITLINKGNKKRKIVTGILSVVLMVLLIGVSYAVWKYTFTGETNVIDTGEVSLEFLESTDVISIENAFPITDEQGITQTEEFDFAVTTKTGKEMDIGYSLYLEKIQTKCSEIESPTQETYPSCYFTISEDDKTALIEWMATENDGFFGSTIEEATQFYDAIVTHDEDKLQSLFIEISDFSYSDASDFATEFESNGYEEYLIDVYQQLTGKTITVNNEFNGENIVYGDSLALKDNEVKIYLTDYEGNVLVGPTRVSNLLDGYLLYNDINEHNAFNRTQTDRYKIKIWVDQNTDASNWDENTKLEYKFKIGVKTPQKEITSTMLMPGPDFNDLIKSPYSVGEVRFITSAKNINTSNAIDNEVYDVSDAQDGSVIAWLEEKKSVTYDLAAGSRILYIATEKDILFANPDSADMFYNFTDLQTINAHKLNVSTARVMNSMFRYTEMLTELDLSSWDTSYVTDACYMFKRSGVSFETIIKGSDFTLTKDMIDNCDS